MFELRFGEEEQGSQEEVDTLAATIGMVRSTRELTKVTVEDTNQDGQRAHVTSNIVFVAAIERMVLGRTWLGAWAGLGSLWRFSGSLLTAWYAQPALDKNSQKWLKGQLLAIPGPKANQIDTWRVARGGVNLANAWFVEPLVGDALTRRDARIYFDHDPADGEYDKTAYSAARRWKPNLGTQFTGELASAFEDWVAFRGRWPWTSVDTSSYLTGDRSYVEKTATIIEAQGGAAPNSGNRAKIADAMLGTFDFFPPTLTARRTAQHAAACAARHVVEQFRYHPGVLPAWRDGIAAAFLTSWEETIEQDAAGEESKSGGKKRKRDEGRDTRGLRALQKQWEDVTAAYNTYYTAFKTALG
jgi:hypothetical protein